MENQPKGTLEKILLAGIGALAMTAEKTREMLDELVRQGELTLEQGKVINEELKHNSKAAMPESQELAVSMSVIVQNIDKMTPEERAQILSKLQEDTNHEQNG